MMELFNCWIRQVIRDETLFLSLFLLSSRERKREKEMENEREREIKRERNSRMKQIEQNAIIIELKTKWRLMTSYRTLKG